MSFECRHPNFVCQWYDFTEWAAICQAKKLWHYEKNALFMSIKYVPMGVWLRVLSTIGWSALDFISSNPFKPHTRFFDHLWLYRPSLQISNETVSNRKSFGFIRQMLTVHGFMVHIIYNVWCRMFLSQSMEN